MSILSKLGIVTASDRAERQRTLDEEIAIANAQQQEAKKAEKERIAQEQRRARREQERQERRQGQDILSLQHLRPSGML